MIGILLGFLLIVVGLVALTLQRLYSSVPAKELKRLARKSDHLAGALYRPVAYGAAARLLLWLIVGITLAVGLLTVLRNVPTVAGFAVLGLTMIVAFVWIPSMQLSVHKAQFAAFLAPALVKLLTYTHRPLDKLAQMVGQYRELPRHSRMYEKQDFLELIGQQKEQVDNRIELHELELAERALTFGDRQAADVAQLSKDTLLVNADDTLGPILLDQLHKSGQSSFLVYKDGKENIMGSLSMADAVNAANKGSRIFDLVHHDLAFVNEDFSLRQVLTAFQKTEQPIVIVVNKFEEFIGVITFQSLMTELLGSAQDEDLHYDNRTEIANYKPKEPVVEQAAEDKTDEQPIEQSEDAAQSDAKDNDTSPEATEVVE